MNRNQLMNLVARPLYEKMHNGMTGLEAFMMCVAHESTRGEFIHQVQGPALGIIQMEPLTHDDTWKEGDSIWDNALKVGIITAEEYVKAQHPPAERLIYDLQYNAFMFRQRLFMKPGKLPQDLKELSRYLKTHWNSALGKADELSYYRDYLEW